MSSDLKGMDWDFFIFLRRDERARDFRVGKCKKGFSRRGEIRIRREVKKKVRKGGILG